MRTRWILVCILAIAVPVVSTGLGPAQAEAQMRPPAVLAAVSVYQVKTSLKSYAVVHPIAIYGRGRYRDGIISAPEIDKIGSRISGSILHKMKTFTLYLRGEPAGVARVRKVAASADYALHCMPSVAGFGVVEWTRPVSFAGADETTVYMNALDDILPEDPRYGEVAPRGYAPVETRVKEFEALSVVGPGTQAFFKRRALTAHQRALLTRVAGVQLRAEARRTWDGVGRVTPRGDIKLISAELIDFDRNGTVEVVAVFNAPLVKPRPTHSPGEPPPGLQMLMAVTLPAAGKPSILLSLPTLSGLGPDVSEAYALYAVLDLDGDGIGELVLKHDFYYEDLRFEIYRLIGGRLVRVLIGAYQGC